MRHSLPKLPTSLTPLLKTHHLRLLAAVIICAIYPSLGCNRSTEPTETGAALSEKTEFQITMASAYERTKRLYGFVWSSDKFTAPENRAEISTLLEELSKDFHRVGFDPKELSADNPTPKQFREPGFEIILKANQALLKDIRKRFHEGMYDYSLWRLRGLTTNCIACHSRFEVPTDFIGDVPRTLGMSYDERIARSDFLFASRQFFKASAELFSIAQSQAGNSARVFQALKQWLVIEVRVKEQFGEAAKLLDTSLPELGLAYYYQDIVVAWIEQLLRLEAERGAKLTAPLDTAEEYLRNVRESASIETDERLLVYSLRATAILHTFLEGKRSVENRRRALFLLGTAYGHIPIDKLAIFRELYLEQCIREFPQTEEARKSFELLKSLVELQNTGSQGLRLEGEERAKLRELRELAFGKEPPKEPTKAPQKHNTDHPAQTPTPIPTPAPTPSIPPADDMANEERLPAEEISNTETQE